MDGFRRIGGVVNELFAICEEEQRFLHLGHGVPMMIYTAELFNSSHYLRKGIKLLFCRLLTVVNSRLFPLFLSLVAKFSPAEFGMFGLVAQQPSMLWTNREYNPMPGIKNFNNPLQNSNGSCGLSHRL
jgi:hypothetical protein